VNSSSGGEYWNAEDHGRGGPLGVAPSGYTNPVTEAFLRHKPATVCNCTKQTSIHILYMYFVTDSSESRDIVVFILLMVIHLGGSILELAQEYSRDLFIVMKKYVKQPKKNSLSCDLSRKGHAFPGQALHKDSSFFGQNMGLMCIKRRRI
jgi:hypothetical protein